MNDELSAVFSQADEETAIKTKGRLSRGLDGIRTAIWEKWVDFRHEWKKITASALVSPMLYMIALGWGLGSMVDTGGRPYIDFLVPGIIALATMNTAFSAVSVSLNVQRLFERSFDQIIISPVPMASYIFGQMIGGALRGMYAGVLILLLSLPFGASIHVNVLFFVVMFLNGMVFASLGVLASVIAASHLDISRFSTFVITPMTFLCNTMFPVERMPVGVAAVINCLPLTHTSRMLRGIAFCEAINPLGILYLAILTAGFIILTNLVIQRKSNL